MVHADASDQPYAGLDGGVEYTLERFGLYTAIEY